MIDKETIQKMPLNDLLVYHNALSNVCAKYEADLRPLFNSQITTEQKKWVEINSKLTKAKAYKEVVLSVIEDKAYNELDNYKPEKPKK